MIPTFMNWLQRKKQPVPPVAGGSQPATQSAAGDQNVDYKDLWQANSLGITPKQRAASNAANNPRLSAQHMADIDAAHARTFGSGGSRNAAGMTDQEVQQANAANNPRISAQHLADIDASWNRRISNNND